MRGTDILRYTFLTSVLVGCTANPTATLRPEIVPTDTPTSDSFEPEPAVYFTPTQLPTAIVTETPTPEPAVYNTPTLFSDDMLLTPEYRETAIVQTAESVANIGEDQLIKDGFPEVAISSQMVRGNVFDYTAKIDGVDHEHKLGVKVDSTFVNMDGTPFEDYLINISAGHGVSDRVRTDLLESTMVDSKTFDVQINNFELTEVIFGDGIHLNRSDFGIVFEDTNDADYEIMVIPLANLDPDTADKLKKGAVMYKDILFTNPPKDGKYYGYCKPGTSDFKPIVMIEGQYQVEENSLLHISPYLVNPGCSGSGVFVKTDNEVKYVGITVQNFGDTPEKVKHGAVYPLSYMGEKKFLDQLNLAIKDVLER